MTPQAQETAFRQALEASRLAASERRALAQFIHDAGPDSHTLGVYRHQAFELARAVLAEDSPRSLLDWLEEVVKLLEPKPPSKLPVVKAETWFGPEDDCSGRFMSLISEARATVAVCAPAITSDRLCSALAEADRRGVNVRVIVDQGRETEAGAAAAQLRGAGFPCRFDTAARPMRCRFALFDNAKILLGGDWTAQPRDNGYDSLLLLTDTQVIHVFRQRFERLWRELATAAGSRSASP